MQLENAGGTPGGLSVFVGGAPLSAVSAWFFLDLDLSHFMISFAAGLGLMLRALRSMPAGSTES